MTRVEIIALLDENFNRDSTSWTLMLETIWKINERFGISLLTYPTPECEIIFYDNEKNVHRGKYSFYNQVSLTEIISELPISAQTFFLFNMDIFQ